MGAPEACRAGHEIAFEAFGVPIGVSVDRPELMDRVRRLLPPGSRPCPPSAVERRFAIVSHPGGACELMVEGMSSFRAVSTELALLLLEARIRGCVAAEARDRIFVHAGAVGWRGRAILVPGKRFAGKTTLVAALVRAGALYYSDEFAVLDERGRVHPYAKPLSLRGEDGRQVDREVGSLGGVAGEAPLQAGAIVVTSYRRGAEWRPRRLAPGEGVLALLGNTVPARDRPDESLRAVTRAVAGAVVIESERGDADAVAPLVLAAIDG